MLPRRREVPRRAGSPTSYLDNVPQEPPARPDNVLHVGVGPLTGVIGDKTILSFKSPLTGWWQECNVGLYRDEIVRTHNNAAY